MPGSTPLGIHYPLLTDAPNEAVGMSQMATDIDALIAALQAKGVITESGFVDITPVPNAFTAVAVTFTAGLFPTAPHVFVTPELAGTGSVTACGLNGSPTTSGVSIGVTRSNSTTTRVHWLAILTP